MVKTDKSHFFNVAGACLFLKLTTFYSAHIKKRYKPALHFDSAVLKIGTLPGNAGDCFLMFIFKNINTHSSLFFNIYH